MQNLLAKTEDKKNSKFRPIQDIMKDPLLKTKLNNLVDEAVRAKQRIFLEQQTIKDLRDVARNDLSLNPKLFSYYAAAAFNNDYSARREHIEELGALIDTVIGLLPEEHSAYEGDND